MTARLERVLSVVEVAAIAGWHRRRMLRHLLRVNESVGGMLLRNIGTRERPRYTVTLTALQQCAPEWFRDPEAVETQLAQLRAEVYRLKRIVAMHSEKLAAVA